MLIGLAIPSALVSGLRTAQALTDQAILGHLTFHGHSTPIYLDAAALSLLWMQLTMSTMVRGIGGAVNVLASQAHGAGNTRLADIWLQMGVLLVSPLMALVVGALWLLTGEVVNLFAANQTLGDSMAGAPGGPGDPVDLAAQYARISIGYILPTLWMECLNSWVRKPLALRPRQTVDERGSARAHAVASCPPRVCHSCSRSGSSGRSLSCTAWRLDSTSPSTSSSCTANQPHRGISRD